MNPVILSADDRGEARLVPIGNATGEDLTTVLPLLPVVDRIGLRVLEGMQHVIASTPFFVCLVHEQVREVFVQRGSGPRRE